MRIALSPDDVGTLAVLLPRAGIVYDNGDMIIAAESEAEIAAILQEPDWRERATARANRKRLAAYAAEVRYSKQIAGIEFEDREFDTSPASVAALQGCAVMGDEAYWKAKDGTFLLLSASGVDDLAMAATEHVQACFALEAKVLDGIEFGSITTRAQIEEIFGSK
jgi:hypothetical protein